MSADEKEKQVTDEQLVKEEPQTTSAGDTNNPQEPKSKTKDKNVLEEIGDSVGRFATRTVESIKHTIDKSMNSRNTVLSIRVNEDANKKLNMLVDAGIFKSRSESAAFLIEEGIKHQDALFQKISAKLQEIDKLRHELKDIVKLDQ